MTQARVRIRVRRNPGQRFVWLAQGLTYAFMWAVGAKLIFLASVDVSERLWRASEILIETMDRSIDDRDG